MQTLLRAPVGPLGDAWAANIDGSIIVGQECQPPNPLDQSAWIWTTANGVECLPCLGSGRPSTAISWAAPRPRATNGRVIGGGHAVGLESEAVIWIDRQPHYLKDSGYVVVLPAPGDEK